MNEQELAEIEARVQALFKGEWVEETDENGDEWIRIPGGHDVKFWNIEGSSGCCYDVTHFIAHARQDVPALCAEMRRLNGELAMAMDAVDELSRQMAEIEQLTAENAKLRAALRMIEAAVLPVQTELGMVAVEDVQELIDIAAEAINGGAS